MDQIKEYKKGLPCMLGETLGRIVGESKHGHWTTLNGVKVFSHPQFCTPYGTIIEVDFKSICAMPDSEAPRLKEFETDAKKTVKLYRGLLPKLKL